MNIIICGCIKNSEKYIDNVFKNIYLISKIEFIKVIKVIISYDKSIDNTLEKLNELKLNYKNDFEIVIIINQKPLTKIRTENIKNARNRILEYMRNMNEIIDYFIMMDFDDVCSQLINLNVFEKVFDNKDKWDSVTFNNEKYYDYWALSFDNYVYSCWHYNEPLKIISLMKKDLLKKIKNNIDDYIKVDSSFNGFGIYKYDKYININYQSLMDLSLIDKNKLKLLYYKTKIKILKNKDLYDCEHRYFHLKAFKINNAKHFIYKNYLFPKYNGEHNY